jgi:hypothetical protein
MPESHTIVPPFVTSRSAAPRVTEEVDATSGEIFYDPAETRDEAPADASVPETPGTDGEMFGETLAGVVEAEDEPWAEEAVDAPLIPTAKTETVESPEPAADLPEWMEGVAAQHEGHDLGNDTAAPDAVALAEVAAPLAVMDDVASRLEEIARSLRSKSPAELLSGQREGHVMDPLELLITGFVLGYSQQARPGSDMDLR